MKRCFRLAMILFVLPPSVCAQQLERRFSWLRRGASRSGGSAMLTMAGPRDSVDAILKRLTD
jgi:hypothetical protein